jgi:hypothetical protein
MQYQTEGRPAGNNIEAVKAKRIVVNLFDNTGTNTNVFGQYFFDEYPELNNKTIVGIKFNSSEGQSQGSFFDFSNFTTYIDNNIGLPVAYAAEGEANYLMLNLFNEKNELILQNFPLNSFNTNLRQPIGGAPNTNGKIKPFNTKLNLKASYIFSTFQFTATNPIAVSLTFYYLDK